METRKKPAPHLLKVSDNTLRSKQGKKMSQDKAKESKNLYEYIQKLNNIDTKRVSI